MTRIAVLVILGTIGLALTACEPVGKGISNTGEFLSDQAENPRNEGPD